MGLPAAKAGKSREWVEEVHFYLVFATQFVLKIFFEAKKPTEKVNKKGQILYPHPGMYTEINAPRSHRSGRLWPVHARVGDRVNVLE